MPFNRPTLTELITRTKADAEARLTDGVPLLPVSNVAVLSRVHAGSVHGLYGYLAWLALQLMPDTAELEHLERWASIWDISRLPATYATGSVVFSGTDGATIPAGTALLRADGAQYTTDADGTIVSGTATVAVTAAEAGDSGDAVAGTQVSLISPVSGVQSGAAVASGGLTGGADEETDAALRARLLVRIQEPPHGGADFDYTAWAMEAHPDVTRAWAYPLELGAGAVTVRFMTDDATADGVPEAAVVAAVDTYIQAQRPVTAEVTVVAPVAAPLNCTISITPDTTAVRDAVEASIADMIRRDAVPGGTILLSHLREAISVAAGETDHTLTSPSADVTHVAGQIATMGTITWT